MPSRSALRGRFEDNDADPMTAMGNLVDVMLVFACGLIAALLSQTASIATAQQPREQTIEEGRELPHPPDPAKARGTGLHPLGTVYRDPSTGKLIMVRE